MRYIAILMGGSATFRKFTPRLETVTERGCDLRTARRHETSRRRVVGLIRDQKARAGDRSLAG
jgi:hypothetical protein